VIERGKKHTEIKEGERGNEKHTHFAKKEEIMDVNLDLL
jgi:hypothetical protein